MPWLQFFDEAGNVIREFQASKQAKIFMDAAGTMVLDEFAADTPTNPRVLMIPAGYAYAKSISESARAEELVDRAKQRMEGNASVSIPPGPPIEENPPNEANK